MLQRRRLEGAERQREEGLHVVAELARAGRHRLGGGRLERLDGGDVAAEVHVLADGEQAHELVVPVDRLVGRLAAGEEGGGLVDEDGGLVEAAELERRGVDDRLERRTGLAGRLRRAVVLAGRQARARLVADHRQDRAGLGIEPDDRHLGAVGDLRVLGRRVRGALRLHVDRGGDAEAALGEHARFAEALGQEVADREQHVARQVGGEARLDDDLFLGADRLDHVALAVVGDPPAARLDRLPPRAFGRLAADRAPPDHAVEHHPHAGAGAEEVVVPRVRCRDEAREVEPSASVNSLGSLPK